MTLPPVTQPPVGMASWVRAVAAQVKRLAKSVDQLTGASGFSSLLGKLRNRVNFYDPDGTLSGKMTFVTNGGDPAKSSGFAFFGGANLFPQIEYVGAYTTNDGIFLNDTVNVWAQLALPYIGGTGASGNVYYDINTKQLSYVPSSRRYKEEIDYSVDWGPVIESLKALTPVSFRYKEKPDRMLYGLIAEDVAEQGEHMAPFVDWGAEGQPEGIGNFLAGWMAWNKEQELRIDTLEATVATQGAAITALQAQIARLLPAPEGEN